MPSQLSNLQAFLCALERSDMGRGCTNGLLCLRREKECREVCAPSVKAAHTFVVPPASDIMHTASTPHVLVRPSKGLHF